MAESFIQFPAGKAIPFDGIQSSYFMNPGTLLTTKMALQTPIGFYGKCARFRFLIRGRWGSFFDFEKILVHMTKNGNNIHESFMTFYPTGNLDVITRHQTVYPNIDFNAQDTIGIRLETGGLSAHIQDFYVSAVVNFTHA